MSFLDELKRRNVFRVAIAYGVTGWLIAQIAGLAATSFFAPDWVMKMFITILLLGFPIALVMAWAYELTPDGFRRESGESATHSANTSRLDRTITIALIAALAYFAYDKFVLDPARDAALLESVTVNTPAPSTPDEQDSGRATASLSSIAVLPFVNMSEDAGNEYFADGLSEELLNLLVRIPELKVAARTSSFSYKGKDVNIAQVGEELKVAHVLEGSVRKSGNQLRITAQLIKADDGYHVWSQTYDRTLDNIFIIQDEIATAVVDGLKVTLMGNIPELAETDPEVYTHYLQGKYLMTPPRGSREELEESVKSFEQALAIDPEYAPAWVGLSWAYEWQIGRHYLPHEQGIAMAMEAAERALTIDSNMALAWSTLSYLKKKYEWDWEAARSAMDKALQLEPNNTDVLLGTSSVASTLGQPDRSIELLERAVALDPLRLEGLLSLGRRYLVRGRYDDALEIYQRVQKLYPEHDWAPGSIAEIHFRQGDSEKALAELDKLPYSHWVNNLKAQVLFFMGREQESRALTNEFLQTPAQEAPHAKAVIHAWRGENDEAFRFLELAYEQRHSGLANILITPALARLASDPRYPVFLEKLGLLEAWKAMPPELRGTAP
jgi:TolB-like protein/Tfp pilus assembly protein PilF